MRFGLPPRVDDEAARIVKPVAGRDVCDVLDIVRRLGKLERLGQPVTVYPDAEEFIQRRLYQERMRALVVERFGPGVGYECQFVDRIPQEPSGKYRFCISKVPNPFTRPAEVAWS